MAELIFIKQVHIKNTTGLPGDTEVMTDTGQALVVKFPIEVAIHQGEMFACLRVPIGSLDVVAEPILQEVPE